MKILKKMMFFIIIGFVILNTQIVKASNITIDDIINDLKESQYVKDKFWTVDIVKNGNSLDVTAVDGAKHKFITSYSFNNDIISFTTKDKSGEYISGYAMNETQVLKFLLHSVFTLNSYSENDIDNFFSNMRDYTYNFDKNGIDLTFYETSAGYPIDTLKVNINKINLDFSSNNATTQTTTTTQAPTTANAETSSSGNISNAEENPETGINSRIYFLCLLIFVPFITYILLRNKNMIKKIK